MRESFGDEKTQKFCMDSLMKMRCPIKYGSQFCSFVFRVRVRAEYELLFIFVINIHTQREDRYVFVL